MADKLDPYDVEALERSVNDSATRVSTIWVTFLIFALYLVIAAGTITHRQLFLEDPVKLPVLNIELPLWGFFFLAPILFVIFHAYVMLQVVLLGRTAAAYNAAIDRAVRPPPANASMRQRLANTLFAQIFAGSPGERGGMLGALLKLMAWLTLAIAPVLVLLVFQFKFLPYHSHFVTWTHRILVLIELATVFLLWPLVLDAARDIDWRVLRQPAAWAAASLFVVFSMTLATFPGEPHINLFSGRAPWSIECGSWLSPAIDRLHLANEQLVDPERIARIERDTAAKHLPASEGERARKLPGRNLACGDFDSADLRRIDFTGVDASGARFRGAELQGASFAGAQMPDADLSGAQLQGASLDEAWLPNAILDQAQGASLRGANLDGALLSQAQLQGADLGGAWLRGARLGFAQLQSASLADAKLQGASLEYANLQGATLDRAELQGASLKDARLEAASLDEAQLQGADLKRASLTLASLDRTFIWRAGGANCSESHRSPDAPQHEAVDARQSRASVDRHRVGGSSIVAERMEKIQTSTDARDTRGETRFHRDGRGRGSGLREE